MNLILGLLIFFIVCLLISPNYTCEGFSSNINECKIGNNSYTNELFKEDDKFNNMFVKNINKLEEECLKNYDENNNFNQVNSCCKWYSNTKRKQDIKNIMRWLRKEIKDINNCSITNKKSDCISKSTLIHELPDLELSNVFNNTEKSNHILDYLLEYYKDNQTKKCELKKNIENLVLLYDSEKDIKIRDILIKHFPEDYDDTKENKCNN